jgi:hypothetical protein
MGIAGLLYFMTTLTNNCLAHQNTRRQPGRQLLLSSNMTHTATVGAFSKLTKQEQHALAAWHDVRLTQDGAPLLYVKKGHVNISLVPR